MNFDDEIDALKNYVNNWRPLFNSAAIGIFLYLILSIFKIKIQNWVNHILGAGIAILIVAAINSLGHFGWFATGGAWWPWVSGGILTLIGWALPKYSQ